MTIDEPSFNSMSAEIFDAEQSGDALQEAVRTGRPLAPVQFSMPDGSYRWRFILFADADAAASAPQLVALLAAQVGGEPSYTLGTYKPL